MFISFVTNFVSIGFSTLFFGSYSPIFVGNVLYVYIKRGEMRVQA